MPTKRKSLSAITVSIVLTACSMIQANDTRAQQPNIVFIIADDLGWADVEFHGGNVPTPHLNRLRREGTELTQHYVAPVCSPTRTGFMTGRYWSRFGVTTPTNTLALPPETVTVASALKQAGYATCLTGKWHLGSVPKWGPNHFGFDHSYGSLAGGVTPWSHFYKKGPYSVTWQRNEDLITEKGHVTDLLANEAVQWIQNRDSEKPFFLYVPFTAVHLPIREPDEWLAKVPERISGPVPRQYAACILHLDDAVGRIVNAVDESGKARETLIVFTSDNGGSTAENNDTKYPDDNCPNGRLPGNNLPLRGKKGDLYEGGTRVPTIVRWPGRIESDTSIEIPVHVVDWMPTFCHLGNANVDAEEVKWDGANIWPLIAERKAPAIRSLYSAGVHFRSRSLRRGDWKLIEFSDKSANNKRFELYNITNDPNEQNSLTESKPEKFDALKHELKAASAYDNDAVAQPRL